MTANGTAEFRFDFKTSARMWRDVLKRSSSAGGSGIGILLFGFVEVERRIRHLPGRKGGTKGEELNDRGIAV